MVMRLDERTPGNLNTQGHVIEDKSLKYLIHVLVDFFAASVFLAAADSPPK